MALSTSPRLQRNREQSHQPLQTLLETQPAEETTSAANYGTVLDPLPALLFVAEQAVSGFTGINRLP